MGRNGKNEKTRDLYFSLGEASSKPRTSLPSRGTAAGARSAELGPVRARERSSMPGRAPRAAPHPGGIHPAAAPLPLADPLATLGALCCPPGTAGVNNPMMYSSTINMGRQQTQAEGLSCSVTRE